MTPTRIIIRIAGLKETGYKHCTKVRALDGSGYHRCGTQVMSYLSDVRDSDVSDVRSICSLTVPEFRLRI